MPLRAVLRSPPSPKRFCFSARCGSKTGPTLTAQSRHGRRPPVKDPTRKRRYRSTPGQRLPRRKNPPSASASATSFDESSEANPRVEGGHRANEGIRPAVCDSVQLPHYAGRVEEQLI